MRSFSKYALILVFILMPSITWADIDFASYMSQLARMAPKDGVGVVMQNSIAILQNKSMKLEDFNFSNIDVNGIKNMASTAYKKANEAWQISDQLPSGLTQVINGVGSNPLLREIAEKEFTVGKRSGNDVQKNKELEEKENELMIENVSSVYARGLTRRYQLDNEKADEVEDFNNINAVQAVLSNTLQRADSRWVSILKAESSLMLQTATQQMTSIKPDETQTDDEVDKAGKESASEQNQENNSDENTKSKLQQADEWVKNQKDKADTWVKDQQDKVNDFIGKNNGGVADWLSKGNNQQGVNKIIGGVLGSDSTAGSLLTGATNSLAKHGGSKDSTGDNSSEGGNSSENISNDK